MAIEILPIRSSSKGNAVIVSTDNTKLLVDCGISCKMLECGFTDIGINPSRIDAVFVTHEHSDHIKGVGIFSRKYNVPIYANTATWSAMSGCLGKISDDNIKVLPEGTATYISDLKVKSFSTPHDAASPVGYIFEENGERAAIATDMGEVRENVLTALYGCNTALIEANYDLNMLEIGSYPYDLKRRIKSSLGHLCNETSGKLAAWLAKNGTENIILGHLSPENNYPLLAYQTVKNQLEESGIALGAKLRLSVAEREKAGFVAID